MIPPSGLLAAAMVAIACTAPDDSKYFSGNAAGGTSGNGGGPGGGSGGSGGASGTGVGGASGAGGGSGGGVQSYYAMKCAVCHGDTGMGDGPAGAALDPKPTDFHWGSWQATVTDQQIRQIILEGGAAVGKSAGMPPNPDLANDPVLLNDLVLLIRSYFVVHKIGETVPTSAYSMVVTGAKDCQITGTFAPEPGNMKFGAHVKITATSSTAVPVNPFYAVLTYSVADDAVIPTLGCTPELNSVSLNPGETAEGWITFEIPLVANKLRLHYHPAMVGVLPKELSFDLGW